MRPDRLSSNGGDIDKATSAFELRAEITAYVELRALADDIIQLIGKRLADSSEQIGRYTDAERAEMPTDMQILHRGLYLSFDKIAELQTHISEIVMQCNREIDILFEYYKKGTSI